MKSSTVLTIASLLLFPAMDGPYKTAQPGYRYEFPRDNFNHPEFQTEWWYTTGNLTGADGRRYGFELTFFRQGVDRDMSKNKSWDVQDLYLAHLALSDLDGGKFHHTERTNRAGPGLAGIDEKQERIWNGNWEVQWSGGEETLKAVTEEFSISLKLQAEKPPVIHGENGISQKAAESGRASHYISNTRLNTGGQIQLNGKTIPVSGSSWMDHEFFTNQMGGEQIGWDWLSLQLEDKTEIMLYQFRRKGGGIDPYSSGTYVDAQGKAMHLTSTDFRLLPGGEKWKSGVTSATYPVAWIVEIPKLGLKLATSTRLASQELAGGGSLTPSYWEGAIEIRGSRGSDEVRGVGYLEMTGYAQPFAIGQ